MKSHTALYLTGALLLAACGGGAGSRAGGAGGDGGSSAADGASETGRGSDDGGPEGGSPSDGGPGDGVSPDGGPSPVLGRLPDTTNGIFLYADELSPGMDPAVIRFAATHYAGTQKMLKADNAAFLAINPNWMLLHYRLGSSSGPVQYIHDDAWSSDWSTVTTHEDWFMHNENGMRHYESVDQWYINDISNSGFRDYWVQSVIADMRATGSQGVFADSFEAGVSGYGVTDPDARFDGTNPASPSAWPNGYTWMNYKKDWITYIEAAFAATPERFLFVPNIGAMITGWWNGTDSSRMNYADVDGAMLEGFGQNEAPSDWALGMNNAMALTRAGKFIIAQSYPSTFQERDFLLATYLLVKGSRTFVNLAGAGVYYFPEYAIDLGAPLQPLPSDVSAYSFNGVYRRDFANGIVLVNPGTASVTVPLNATYQQVTATGGGQVTASTLDASGNYTGGSLSKAPVSGQIALPSQSAAFLLDH